VTLRVSQPSPLIEISPRDLEGVAVLIGTTNSCTFPFYDNTKSGWREFLENERVYFEFVGFYWFFEFWKSQPGRGPLIRVPIQTARTGLWTAAAATLPVPMASHRWPLFAPSALSAPPLSGHGWALPPSPIFLVIGPWAQVAGPAWNGSTGFGSCAQCTLPIFHLFKHD
jgi:hypothetical protein